MEVAPGAWLIGRGPVCLAREQVGDARGGSLCENWTSQRGGKPLH